MKMKHSEIVLALAILFTGTAMAMSASGGQAEMEHLHHHHMAMADSSGYQRSLASYDIPDVSLVDAGGVKISLREVLGGDEPVMLNFIFTSCTAICPVMSATFRQVQEQLGEERSKVRMVSISIDPENDTPEKLKEYAGRFEAGPQWRMLTGSVEDSIAVQRAFDSFRGDKMSHEPVTFLRAGGTTQTWVRLDGLASSSDIINEYHKLVAH
ncbi:MAG TPA: SCO family protein [Sideroxyarcus sp.]|nr:SCO family protein [Sideroxyarcus sp.]